MAVKDSRLLKAVIFVLVLGPFEIHATHWLLEPIFFCGLIILCGLLRRLQNRFDLDARPAFRHIGLIAVFNGHVGHIFEGVAAHGRIFQRFWDVQALLNRVRSLVLVTVLRFVDIDRYTPRLIKPHQVCIVGKIPLMLIIVFYPW